MFRILFLGCLFTDLFNYHFVVLVNTFWREGKPDEAIAVVQDMESRGQVGPASLYYDLARCLCSVGRCEEGLMQVC